MDDPAGLNEISLYESDLYAWTQQQAELLRSGSLASLDIDNIIDEIASLGSAQISALRSRYKILCLHILKLMLQSSQEGRGWHVTIVEQRIQIEHILVDSPSLQPRRQALFDEGYRDACKLFVVQTGLSQAVVPLSQPFTIEQAEDEEWLPAQPEP